MTGRTIMATTALAGLVACGGSDQATNDEARRNIETGAATVRDAAGQMAEAGQQNARQMAEGFQQMARGIQQMARGSATAVDSDTLVAMLPEVDGWERSDARGEQLADPVAYSRAEAVYRRGDGRIELEIVDTALSQMLLAPMSMFLESGYSERSGDGFRRAVRIGDSPGLEDWNSADRRGEVTKVVRNRFIVKASGRDVGELVPVRAVVEAVDDGRFPRDE